MKKQIINEATLVPSIVINIAADVQYLMGISQSGGEYAGSGIYMMDNNVDGGSFFQGGSKLELHTMCQSSQIIAFNVFSINELQGLGETVEISRFEVSPGSPNLWAGGAPVQQSSGDYQWLGQVQGNSQTMTYQILITVSSGGIAPETRTFYWDPFIQTQ